MRSDQRETGHEKRTVMHTKASSGGSVRPDQRETGHEKRTVMQAKTPSGGSVRPDYTVYRMSGKEKLLGIGAYLLLDAGISYIFFCSWIAFLLLLPGAVLFLREQRRELQRKRAREMKQQFLDGIQMTASSLQAGYSIENAFREALAELRKIYPPDSFIVREFQNLTAQLDMNRSVEGLLLDLGRRSGLEDIRSFAEVFLAARRSGGDLLAIIRNTVGCIRQKQETMQEIETCLAGKVMEQNIMSLVPLLILAYIKLTSPEFLESMYGNLTGTAVMTICFVIYVAAYLWGKQIVRIEV